MSAHTPGPFSRVALTEGWAITIGPEATTLAVVIGRDDQAEAESNARLFEAAPDLLVAACMALEALRIALRYTLPSDDITKNGNIVVLEAAIAKAEGR
jgi:hypothetical protein